MNTTVGLMDDQQLFLKTLGLFINSLSDFQVSLYASDRTELLNLLSLTEEKPEILLINVDTSPKEGIELVSEIKKYYPEIKIIALSMIENSQNIVGMMGAGCCAYLLKTMHSDDLKLALQEVSRNGHHNNYSIRLAFHTVANAKQLDLKEREREFLALACSDLTYQEIAEKMLLSFKTIDGYRAGLFGKFQVKSRVGLILAAIRQKLVLL